MMLLNFFRDIYNAIRRGIAMVLNQAGIQYYSGNNYDMVIFSDTRTINLTFSGGGIQTKSLEFDSGINQSGLPLGIYSIDGGNTWNDMGGPATFSGSSYPFYPTIQVQPFVNSKGQVVYSVTASGNGGYAIQTRLVILASDNPGILPESVVPTTNQTSYEFGTPNTYRQIVNTTTQALTDFTIYTLPHGQGVVPLVQNWVYLPNKSEFGITDNWYTLVGVDVDQRWLSSVATNIIGYDATNIYIATELTTPRSAYYRIYQL
jgi:hypothetical protein